MRTFSGLGFDPTPGEAADVEEVLRRVEHTLGVLDGSAGDLRRAARASGWTGTAAAAFRAATAALPAGLDGLAAALRATARTLATWQARLVTNQREAELLDLGARRLRVELTASADERPVVREELTRVLDRARRLRARHLRQADDAARAVRSLTGTAATAGWPEGSADLAARWSDRVTAWSGGVALGMATPARPDAAVPGTRLAAGDLASVPGLHSGPGGRDLPDLPGREGPPVDAAAPDVRGATASAGWLDTGTAPAHRMPDPPAPRPVEPAAPAVGSATPAATAAHHRVGAESRHAGAPRHPDPPARTGGRSARAAPPGGAEVHGRAAAPATKVAGAVGGPGGATTAHPLGVGPDPARPRVEPPADRDTSGDTGEDTYGNADLDADRTVEQQATAADPERRGPGQPAPAERPAEQHAGHSAGQPAERAGPRAVALEPGRLTAADPGARQAPAGPPAQVVTGKDRDERDDHDPLVVMVGRLAEDGEAPARRPDRVRVLLLHKPDARPVLAIARTGRAPLFVTGLTPCAGDLPDCAAAVPDGPAPTVY